MISFLLTLTALAQPVIQPPLVITLDDVVKKVSTENYTVYANALRVYQAREAVHVARMNLLPSLKLWSLAGTTIDIVVGTATGNPAAVASGTLGIIEDIAPFLVPANWFRVKQAKKFYVADQEGYRALWANELMSAKALYYHLLLDRSLLQHVEKSEQELSSILTIVKMRELLGGVPQGVSREIEVRKLSLQEDQRALQVLIADEASVLATMMALPSGTNIVPADIEFPSVETYAGRPSQDLELKVLQAAPELAQFNALIDASNSVRKEVKYAFLGTSSVSRGVAGGVFDSLPTQQGLGFGTGSSVRIVKAQKEILKTQRLGVEETLKRQLRTLQGKFALDLKNYESIQRREELTQATMNQLYERMRFGQSVETLELIEASRNHIQAETAFLGLKFRFLENENKLSRMLFSDDYSKPPVVIQ